jgi:hypothetical protein
MGGEATNNDLIPIITPNKNAQHASPTYSWVVVRKGHSETPNMTHVPVL